jgi:hypothetical protein
MKKHAISNTRNRIKKTKRLFFIYIRADKEFDKWEMASQRRFI